MHGIYKSTHKTTHTQTHKHTVGTEECSVAFQLPDRTHGHRQHAPKRLPISTMTDEHDSVHEHCPSCHVCMSSNQGPLKHSILIMPPVHIEHGGCPRKVRLSFRRECPLRQCHAVGICHLGESVPFVSGALSEESIPFVSRLGSQRRASPSSLRDSISHCSISAT